MSAPSEAASERPRIVHAVRPFYWSVRRELWENRSIVVAPVIVAGLLLFGFVLGLLHPAPGRNALPVAATQGAASAALFLTGLLVATFYCLGALHSERRDRSILFWKSLPVSDLTTVLSKAAIPLAVMPAVVFVVLMATKLMMLVLSAAALSARGQDAAALWAAIDLPRDVVMALYSLVTQALWHAPVWAWLLLVSAWAKRAPLLWAVGLPVAPCIVERIGFGSSRLADLLGHRLTGWPTEAFEAAPRGRIAQSLTGSDLGGFLSSPDLWVGLAIAAAFLAASVWLRRRREPI